jgi:cytidyltransferase-like protein
MKVGLATGCFDLFHVSHLHFLERCKSRCDKLLVGVDSDYLVKEVKGPARPIFPQEDRWRLISSLECVDAAFILGDLKDLHHLIPAWQVDVFFKCQVWRERAHHVVGIGTGSKVELEIIEDVPDMISTTTLINRILATKE